MKKYLSILVCCLVCFSLFLPAALAEKDGARDQWLYEKSVEYAVIVGKMAASDAYITTMLTARDDVYDLLSSLRGQDFSRPTGMRVYGYYTTLMAITVKSAIGADVDEDVLDMALQRSYGLPASMIAGQKGPSYLALTGILSVSSALQQPQALPESATVMLEYAGDWEISVTYVVYPDGVVTVSAVPVPKVESVPAIPFIKTPDIYRDEALQALMP